MEWSILVLGLVFAGVAISALFIFASAARLYVSHDDAHHEPSPADKAGRQSHDRRRISPSGPEGDRRKRGGQVEFPLRLGDLIIEHDRRSAHNRRQSTAN